MTEQTAGKPTADEVFSSMNYYDEQAVFKAMGSEWMDVNPVTEMPLRPLLFLRAMVFIDLRRRSDDHASAWEQASLMPISDVQAYFPDAPTELDPEDPETEEGKEPTPSA